MVDKLDIDIDIISAKLNAEDNGWSYLTIELKDVVFTTTHKKGFNPLWNQTFTLQSSCSKGDTIKLSVYRKKKITLPYTFEGSGSISLKDIKTPSNLVPLTFIGNRCGDVLINFPRCPHNNSDWDISPESEPNLYDYEQGSGRKNSNENDYRDESTAPSDARKIWSFLRDFMTKSNVELIQKDAYQKEMKLNREISILKAQASTKESQLNTAKTRYDILNGEFNMQKETRKKENRKLQELLAESNLQKKAREEVKKSTNDLKAAESKYRKLESEKAELEERYSECHSELYSLNDEFEEEKKRAQKAESRLSNSDAKINNMNEKLKKNEEIILELRRRVGDLPSSDIEIGAYEYGGINPAIIDDHWRTMFKNLQQAIRQALKGQSRVHYDSEAAVEYRLLLNETAKNSSISALNQSYVICRSLTRILVHFCRYTLMKPDGSLDIFRNVDIVKCFAESSGNIPFSRHEYAKEILNHLPKPNEINGKAISFLFENLWDPLKMIIREHFETYLNVLRNIVNFYSIGNGSVYSALVVFLYTAFYVTIQMSVISDNTITAYWSASFLDRELIGIQFEGFILAPQTETLYNEVERRNYPMDSMNSGPFVLFSIFPGCAHFDKSGAIKVISSSKVFCVERE